MGVRYSVVRGVPVPEYVCQREAIQHAQPLCAHVGGAPIDRAIGDLLVEAVSPLALEAALGIEAELAARVAEADVPAAPPIFPLPPGALVCSHGLTLTAAVSD